MTIVKTVIIKKSTKILNPCFLHFMQKRFLKRFFVKNSTPAAQQRPYATVRSGWYKGNSEKLRTADARSHQVVTARFCDKAECSATNCAQPNDVCDLSEDEAKNAIVPYGVSNNNYRDAIVGNLTHRVPPGKEGLRVDDTRDYSGNARVQYMVVEPDAPAIDSDEALVTNSTATQYVQEPEHSAAILHTPLSDGETLSDKIKRQ